MMTAYMYRRDWRTNGLKEDNTGGFSSSMQLEKTVVEGQVIQLIESYGRTVDYLVAAADDSTALLVRHYED